MARPRRISNDQILEATRKAVLEHGATVSLDVIAHSLAVTPPAVFNAAGAFALPTASRDSVLFLALPAGTYTAQVSGNGNTTGPALVEIYEVNNSPAAFITRSSRPAEIAEKLVR